MTSHERKRGFARAVLAFVLVANGVSPAGVTAAVRGAGGDDVDALEQRLAACGDDGADDDLVRELSPLDATGVEVVLSVLERTDGGLGLPGGALATLSAALRASPHDATAQQLARGIDERSSLSRCRGALWMLDAAPHSTGLAAAIECGNRWPDALGDAVQRTIETTLRLDGRATLRLADLGSRASAELVPHVARALGEVGQRDGLAALVSLLHRSAESDAVVLETLARCAERHVAPFAEDVRREVRSFVERGEGAARLAAVCAAGALEDTESATRLVALLEHEDRRLAMAAHRAVKRVSGEGFVCRPSAWNSWLRGEALWWREQAPELLATLRTADPPDVGLALRSIASHPLHRHTLALDVQDLLDDRDVTLATLACATLAQLGSHAAVPALERALADPAVGPHARKALDRLAANDPHANRP